jgi:hypothetical protein
MAAQVSESIGLFRFVIGRRADASPRPIANARDGAMTAHIIRPREITGLEVSPVTKSSPVD